MVQHIVVTGGNSGIGLALCEQLAKRGCKVYLGSRDAAKGEAAVKAIKAAVPSAAVELLQIDVGSDASVATAAAAIGSALGGEQLYAIVNNAGTGLAHGVDSQTMINTNFYGPKRVVAAFLPLLTSDGRIVNVGSGAGPSYIKKCTDRDVQQTLCSAEATWEQIEQAVQRGLKCDGRQGYGCSKAGVGAYTMLLARSHPGLLISCVSRVARVHRHGHREWVWRHQATGAGHSQHPPLPVRVARGQRLVLRQRRGEKPAPLLAQPGRARVRWRATGLLTGPWGKVRLGSSPYLIWRLA